MTVNGTGKVNFDGFCRIAAHFLEEEDSEAMQEELKEAFRLYDREGNGYITTKTLREILQALDDKLGPEDLDGIIAEIDTDGSGTVDFDGEFPQAINTLNVCFRSQLKLKLNTKKKQKQSICNTRGSHRGKIHIVVWVITSCSSLLVRRAEITE
ncbi:hypothetical protein Cfor_02592 [Coptotermes formosanus]|uniref:EF-hand domain-containing protein n=1 Tax=Coptotermes formosanus TaxID=36987 RepID=A0A6L2Q2G4_COPFO|nr:hypothetical protein Cfor_02592 [Coptotermes formosanus]